MNKSELFDLKPKGIVTINQIKDGRVIKSETQHNLIVERAHTIVRDLLFNGDFENTLGVLQIGDMNRTYEDDLDNLPQPSYGDVTLVNKIFQVEAEKITRFKDLNRYCIRLEFTVPKYAGNDEDESIYYSLVAEFGLFTRNLSMFSRLVKPIIKTRDIALNVIWTIYI